MNSQKAIWLLMLYRCTVTDEDEGEIVVHPQTHEKGVLLDVGILWAKVRFFPNNTYQVPADRLLILN